MRTPLALACLSILVATTADAAPVGGEIVDGTVTYGVSHPLKAYEGILTHSSVSGTVSFDPDDPAATTLTLTIDPLGFDSGNRRRDSHALESLEHYLYPTIEFEVPRVAVQNDSGPGASRTISLRAGGKLNLHGQRLDFPIDVELTLTEGGRLNATSAFTVLLSDFSIHRDSLLGAAIADEVPVRVDLTWQLEAQPEAPAAEPAEAAEDASAPE